MPPDPDDRSVVDLDQLGYADAVDELESILAELESDDVDVDVLAARVARAADLVRLCRDRLAGARVEVDRIVADLEALDGDRAVAGPTGADDGELPLDGT